MEDYQKRVIEEAKELSEKLSKLVLFLGTSVAAALPHRRRHLKRQSEVMLEYLSILNVRMGEFDKGGDK